TYFITGGDSGLFITDSSRVGESLVKIHSKACYWMDIFDNYVLTISGPNARMFQHNILSIISETKTPQKSSTLKTMASQINSKMPDVKAFKDFAVKIKVNSIKIPNMNNCRDATLFKKAKTPILATYNLEEVIIAFWNPTSSEFISSRKLQLNVTGYHKIFKFLYFPDNKIPYLCLKITKSEDKKMSFALLDIEKGFITDNYFLRTDNSLVEDNDINDLFQINKYVIVTLKQNTVHFYDTKGNEIKEMSEKINAEFKEAINFKDYRVFMAKKQICILGEAYFYAFDLFTGEKTQYLNFKGMFIKLLFQDESYTLVSSIQIVTDNQKTSSTNVLQKSKSVFSKDTEASSVEYDNKSKDTSKTDIKLKYLVGL
ncbi:MAG: Mitogen-activated protein kinase kinase kinase kinase 3, partial [Paramarteilia canceri]